MDRNGIHTCLLSPLPLSTYIHTVMPGGVLDIRSVSLYKGSARTLRDGNLKLATAGVARVYLGGTFRGPGEVGR